MSDDALSIEERTTRLGRQLDEASYAVWPGLYDAERIARMRDALERVYRDAGSPVPYGQGVTWLGDDVELSSTGFVVHKLLGRARALHQELLLAPAVEIVRHVLGGDMHLEMVAGVICDHRRPFFEWHMHVGGIDDESYRRAGRRPTFTRHERVAMLVYLDAMTPGPGQLLVLPRRVDDPIDAPEPTSSRTWRGQVEVSGPPGTTVFMDQCTWHAVQPQLATTLRMFVGFWFAASYATGAERTDETLLQLEAPDPLLRSVLPRRP